MGVFNNYEDLQASIEARLKRPAGSYLSTWIGIVETWLARGFEISEKVGSPPLRLLEYEKITTFNEIPDSGIVRPSDYLDVRQMRASYYGERRTLTAQPLANFSELALRGGDAVYTMRGSTFEFAEGVSGPLILHYHSKIPHLTTDNYGDHLLAQLDDTVYLYGALTEAHQQFRNNVDAMKDFVKFRSAVVGLNAQARRSFEGEAPMRAVIPGGVP